MSKHQSTNDPEAPSTSSSTIQEDAKRMERKEDEAVLLIGPEEDDQNSIPDTFLVVLMHVVRLLAQHHILRVRLVFATMGLGRSRTALEDKFRRACGHVIQMTFQSLERTFTRTCQTFGLTAPGVGQAWAITWTDGHQKCTTLRTNYISLDRELAGLFAPLRKVFISHDHERSVQLNQRFIAGAWFTGEAKQILKPKIRFSPIKGGISRDNEHINDGKFSDKHKPAKRQISTNLCFTWTLLMTAGLRALQNERSWRKWQQEFGVFQVLERSF